MVIASGKVVDGRVELDSELPEGASVTVLAREGDETFEADPETERMLLDAIAQCERGGTIPMTQLLGELRSRECASRSPAALRRRGADPDLNKDRSRQRFS